VLRKAMVFPSGDHFGSESRLRPRVSVISSRAPPRRLSIRLATSSPASGSIRAFTQTAHSLSGEIRKLRASSASRMSSIVQGLPGLEGARGAAREGETAASRASSTRDTDAPRVGRPNRRIEGMVTS
jgi:hypothetical protein